METNHIFLFPFLHDAVFAFMSNQTMIGNRQKSESELRVCKEKSFGYIVTSASLGLLIMNITRFYVIVQIYFKRVSTRCLRLARWRFCKYLSRAPWGYDATVCLVPECLNDDDDHNNNNTWIVLTMISLLGVFALTRFISFIVIVAAYVS